LPRDDGSLVDRAARFANVMVCQRADAEQEIARLFPPPTPLTPAIRRAIRDLGLTNIQIPPGQTVCWLRTHHSKCAGVLLTSFPHEFIELATCVAVRPGRRFGNCWTKDIVAPTDLNGALAVVVREVDLIALARLRVEIREH